MVKKGYKLKEVERTGVIEQDVDYNFIMEDIYNSIASTSGSIEYTETYNNHLKREQYIINLMRIIKDKYNTNLIIVTTDNGFISIELLQNKTEVSLFYKHEDIYDIQELLNIVNTPIMLFNTNMLNDI